MSVPTDALTHIKCTACNKFLSYFPIYVEKNTLQPICGRCSEMLAVNENYLSAPTYEALAQFLKFPCIYGSEGCVESLLPCDVPAHEKICHYRTVSCALDCIWQGTLAELTAHVEEVHPNSILRNGEFEIDILNSYETFSFLKHDDELFSFKRKFNASDKIFQCSLFCYKLLNTVTQYFYEMSVCNGNRNLSVKFPLKSADSFLEENVTEISVENAKKMLDDPSIIIGSVRIFTTEEQKTPAVRKPNPDINFPVLSELECPICMEYIIPPIFQCVTGHSICADCKNKVTECPTCKGEMKNTQNFVLEKMAYLFIYPCKFYENGCDFASQPGKIKQHQKYCLFGPQQCPLKDYENCNWKSAAKEIYPHIISQHHDNLLEIDNVYIFFNNRYLNSEDNQCYIKKVSDVMFQIHYRYVQNCFYWAVQLIGPSEQARNYKFEIDILDNTNSNQKMFLRSFCAPLTEKHDVFTTVGQYVYLRADQIKSFITDNLNFIIRILK